MKIVFPLVFIFLLTGCAFTTQGKISWVDARYDLSWPKETSGPRVRFLRNLSGEKSLEQDSSVTRIFRLITGGRTSEGPSLLKPYAVAADGEGRVWVADTGTRLVHFFDLKRQRGGVIATVGETALSYPSGVAYDGANDRLYISDALMGKVFACRGDGSFIGELDLAGGFKRPAGIAIGRKGRVYVADVVLNSVLVFSSIGDYLQTISAGAEEASLQKPLSVFVDSQERIYVCDSLNFHIDIFDSDGHFLASIGQVGDTPGTFARPRGVAVDSQGHIYVSDAAFDNIQVFDMQGNLLNHFGSAGSSPGYFSMPSGLYLDSSDRLYVADSLNERVQIFQYLPPQL